MRHRTSEKLFFIWPFFQIQNSWEKIHWDIIVEQKNYSSWAPTKKLFKQKSPIITHIQYSSPSTLRLLAHLTSTQKKQENLSNEVRNYS